MQFILKLSQAVVRK